MANQRTNIEKFGRVNFKICVRLKLFITGASCRKKCDSLSDGEGILKFENVSLSMEKRYGFHAVSQENCFSF